MIKCKEGLNSSNKNAENSRTKELVLEKRKWNLKIALMKQGVLQDESMEIHVASMSNGGEQQKHEKNSSKSEENSGEERQNGIERGDKYGPRTLPKPRGWMHQRLGWL